MAPRTKPVAERFWPKVNKTDSCWLWTGGSYVKGYGKIFNNGRVEYAHRVSYELANGPIPDGLFVLHHCDVRLCVNPDHLYLGTLQDNARDRVNRSRHPHAKLTDPQVEEIRTRYAAGGVRLVDLGAEFGICHSAVSSIVRYKHYKVLRGTS